MGTKQSSLAKTSTSGDHQVEQQLTGSRGHSPEESHGNTNTDISLQEEPIEISISGTTVQIHCDNEPFESTDDQDSELSILESENEVDIYLERKSILEDARKLKFLAEAYLHPEKSVSVESTATARCFFDRFSSPSQETKEDINERAQILADAVNLMKLARDYLHPEIGVETTDPAAYSRNYFNRPSAPEQEDA
eukprot:CAMPEP_0184861158 /NCGR_PEP_ID=MMETSP0580-20130426/5921_1 /TAXON_ID=1118495 /ORGANISM="Dactyliosolen fragilissimus" /LENGTH=193 /DNA_ID=CAMNT_0027358561 /DNA_START=55 /DNA_END=633 /DNA_ORIENTATION=+